MVPMRLGAERGWRFKRVGTTRSTGYFSTSTGVPIET
jgi:hypothetical protein